MNPAIPADLEQIILKCLTKKPSDRYPDAASLRLALASCSAATGWGPEQAANWWRSIEKTPPPEPPAATKPEIDATLDSVGNQ